MSDRLTEWLQALESKDTVSSKSKSIGIYQNASGMVQIIKERGNSLKSVGKHISGTLTVFPEEAMYLIQRGVLQVFLEESELTSIEFQQMILQHVDLNVVILYAYFASKSYIIRRSIERTTYDVYLQSNTFRKSQPGTPAFRIALCDFRQPFPSVRALNQLRREHEPVQVKLAVVDSSNVVLVYDIDGIH